VSVANGVFTVQLDFGANAFPGADRFLETSVRLTGGGAFTILAPRQPITSTPYAIRTLSATTADALSSACVGCLQDSQINSVAGSKVNGAIPVASVPGGSGNYIQNATTQQAGSNFNISGDGTAGGTFSGNIVNASTQFNLGGSRAFAVTGAAAFPTGNTFAGVDSGTANSPQNGGLLNSFFGGGAGRLNSSGAENSFFGTLTGRSNTTGTGNSYFGDLAGASNTTAPNGSFFGSGAGFSNRTGGQNSFFGQQSGNSNDGGFNNSFFGAHSGMASVSGSNNSFFGMQSGFANVSGSNNTIVGANADLGSSGLTNATAIGFGAVVSQSNSLVLGNNANVGIGTTAPTERLHVVGNGLFTGNFTVNGTLNATLPAGSVNYIQNTTTQQANSNFNISGNGVIAGNVGIGTTSPTSTLHVAGNTYLVGNKNAPALYVQQNTPGQYTGFITTSGQAAGASFGLAVAAGTNANDFSFEAGNQAGIVAFAVRGDGNVGIGTAAPAAPLEVRRNGTIASDWQTGQLRISGKSDANMQLNLGYDTSSNLGVIQAGQAFTGFRTLSLNPFGGNVGIGTSIPVSKLDLVNPNGDGFVRLNFVSPGFVAVCHNASLQLSDCSSSLRYKTNVVNFRFGLELISQLRPITFDWKDGGMHDLGLGAEDVEKIEPLLVTYNKEGKVEGVKYERIGVVLINAVKEQQAQIEKQQELLKRQQEQIKRQEDQVRQQRATFAAQQQQLDALKKLVCRTHSRAAVCRR
jgi:hypothetical protein